MNLEEFEQLLKVVPRNDAEMRGIAKTFDYFARKHPELRAQIMRIRDKFNPIKNLEES